MNLGICLNSDSHITSNGVYASREDVVSVYNEFIREKIRSAVIKSGVGISLLRVTCYWDTCNAYNCSSDSFAENFHFDVGYHLNKDVPKLSDLVCKAAREVIIRKNLPLRSIHFECYWRGEASFLERFYSKDFDNEARG